MSSPTVSIIEKIRKMFLLLAAPRLHKIKDLQTFCQNMPVFNGCRGFHPFARSRLNCELILAIVWTTNLSDFKLLCPCFVLFYAIAVGEN